MALLKPSDERHLQVTNTVESADSVVQAGVIHGDVNVHADVTMRVVDYPYRAGRVPQRADSFQRREISSVLAETLAGGQVAVLASDHRVHTSVLSGLGGVGKTQLAADYAETLWENGALDLLVWITASSRDEIVAMYARLAADLLAVREPDPAVAANRFLSSLTTGPSRWLIVLDDLRTPADLRGLWPPAHPTGSVIVTTRRRDASLRGHARRMVEVGLFTPVESSAYLNAKLEDRAVLADAVPELATVLGHLPLALSQAVAYMLDQQLSCSGYITKFVDRRKRLEELVPSEEELPDDYQATLATTWSLSVELADRLKPAGLARPVLNLMALMDPNGILVDAVAMPGTLMHLSAVTGTPVTADLARGAIACLHRLNLVTADLQSTPAMTRVHALVQRATRDVFSDDERARLPGVAAASLCEMWARSAPDPVLGLALRANCAALHAEAGPRLWASGDHKVLFLAGTSLGEAGHVSGALRYFEQLGEEAVQQLGENHAAVFVARVEAACWREADGDPRGAALELKRLLPRLAALVGANHQAVFATRCFAAEFSGGHDGSKMDPDELHDLAVESFTVLGHDHPVVLRVLSNLVRSQDGADGSVRTLRLYEKVIADQLRLFGTGHRDMFRTRRYLASWRLEANDLLGALVEVETLVKDQVAALGRDHPDVLFTRGMLARLRSRAAERELVRWSGVSDAGAEIKTSVRQEWWRAWRGVEASLRQLHDDRARLLGRGHPDTEQARSAMVSWTAERNRTGVELVRREIASLRRKLIEIREYYGPRTPGAFESRLHLARLYTDIGEVSTAAALLEELYVDQVAVYGGNPQALEPVQRELVWHRTECGDRAGAVCVLEEIAAGNSQWAAVARADLDYWWGRAHERVRRDIEELTKMLAEDTAEFGAEHRYTLTTGYLLASRLGAAGRIQDAVAMLAEIHEACVQTLGQEHPDAVRAEDELRWWQQGRAVEPQA